MVGINGGDKWWGRSGEAERMGQKEKWVAEYEAGSVKREWRSDFDLT